MKKVTECTKVFLFLLISFLFISLICAETNNYAPIRAGNCIDLKQTCGTCTYNNITISYPNSTAAVVNFPMSNNGGGQWNYTFCKTNDLGRYDVSTCGDLDGTFQCIGTGTLWFIVSPTGQDYSTSQAIQYSLLLAFGLILFFLTLYGAIKFPWKNERDDEGTIISVNNLKYLKIVLFMLSYLTFLFVVFICKNMAYSFQGGIYELFNITFNILLSLLLPFFPTLIAFTVIIWISDKKTQQDIMRGTNYEN